MEFGDARVGAEKEKYGILGKTVKIIKTPLACHTERSEVGFLFSPYKFEGRIGFLMGLQAEFQDSVQKTTAQSRADIGNEREFGFSFECTRTHNYTRFCAP